MKVFKCTTFFNIEFNKNSFKGYLSAIEESNNDYIVMFILENDLLGFNITDHTCYLHRHKHPVILPSGLHAV